MFSEFVIDPFREGEWFMGVLGLFFFLLLFTAGILLINLIGNEISWAKIEPVPHKATLISTEYAESTIETHVVPVATGKSVGAGVVTTGSPEKHITVWDLGEYGRVVCDDKTVFQYAKPESVLMIKVRGKAVKIVGIQ